MRSPRQSFQSFISTTLDYEESQRIDPDHLDQLVTRLRAGDESVANEIAMGHLRLVMSLVASIPKRRAVVDDIVGAALLALTEAVHDAANALHDNNITAYITTTVKYKIKTFKENDHTVRVPGRTVRHKITQGELFTNIVPGDPISIREDVPDEENGEEPTAKGGDYALPFFIPVAKRDVPLVEFKEALLKSIESETQRAIIKCRSEGHTIVETGELVGYGKSSVQKMLAGIETRFDAYYK